MNVNFYKNWAKRRNSTKQPQSSDINRTIDCQLKEPCSIESPVLRITTGGASSGWQDTLNYAYIPSWGRYYFVADATYTGGNIWEVSLEIDALASNRASILNTTAFIEYSGLSGELYVPDGRLTMRGPLKYGNRTTVTLMDGNNEVLTSNLTYYVTVTNTYGADTCYEMSGYQFQRLCKGLLEINTSSVMEQLQIQLGSIMQGINSVIAMPFSLNAHTSSGGISHAVVISDQTIFEGGSGISCVGWIPDSSHPNPYDMMYSGSENVNIPAGFGDYRDLSPYTQYTLWLPYYGSVDLPCDTLAEQSTMTIQYVISVRDANITYKIICNNEVLGIYTATIGQQVAIAQIMGNTVGMLKDAMGMASSGLGSLATGNYLNMAESLTGGLVNMGLHGLERHISRNGSSTGAPMKYLNRQIVLSRHYHEAITTPDNLKPIIGAPYMRVDSLSGHAGYYVKTNNASVAVSHYSGEADTINAALDSGVFLD